MDITKMVKAAAKYRVKKENDCNMGKSSLERWDSWTALDELRRWDFDLKMGDTEWVVVHRPDRRNRHEEVEVARFPRKKAMRKTCLCYMEAMPDVPRITV